VAGEFSRFWGRRLLNLSESEIHIWFSFPGETKDPQESDAVCPVLDEGEKARMERFHFPDDCRLFEESHALLRRTLSRYSEVLPQEWRFVKDAHGKPRIDPNIDSSALSFSLSHTKGLAVVAVTGGADIGVDVERTDRIVGAARLTCRFFSPEETIALQDLPPERLRERFFLYWTLKESYIKARGLGLSLPLDSFSFRLEGEMPLRIVFSRDSTDGPGGWRFALFKPLEQYAAAVSLLPSRPDPVRIRCFQIRLSGEISPLRIDPEGCSPGMEID
jgi:4'-phosphopantetheinyl transferase